MEIPVLEYQQTQSETKIPKGLWVSPIDHSLYSDVLCDWWREWGRAVVPRRFLPHVGLMLFKENTPLLSGWLYTTDSQMGVFAWVCRNPQVDKITDEMWSALISTVKKFAWELGIRIIFSTFNHPHIVRALRGEGFDVTAQGMKSLYGRVGEEVWQPPSQL